VQVFLLSCLNHCCCLCTMLKFKHAYCRVPMWWNLTIDIHPIIWCEIYGLNGEMIMRGYAKEIYRKTRFCFYFQVILFSTTDLLLHTDYFCTYFLKNFHCSGSELILLGCFYFYFCWVQGKPSMAGLLNLNHLVV
jgi:hypothetical protein